MIAVFWLSIVLLAYTYVGYALIIRALARRRTGHAESALTPPLTVVIAAYNEASRIAARVRNVLEQDYPAQNLSVIVVSDGSTDGTEHAAAIDDPRVRVIALAQNGGKAVAVNAALESVQTEFVVFTDARQRFAPDALKRLLAPFADAHIGAVSGELEIVENFSDADRPPNPAPIGLYWRMEKSLRDGEAGLGWLHGVSGAI